MTKDANGIHPIAIMATAGAAIIRLMSRTAAANTSNATETEQTKTGEK